MNSPDPGSASSPAFGARNANAFAGKIRQRIAAIPEHVDNVDIDSAAQALDGFSIARIYTTFQLKRSEYFPTELDDAAFELLVDLFLHEWLNRRVGAQQGGGIRIGSGDLLPAGAQGLVNAGLAAVTMAQEGDDESHAISLTRAGRTRLNLYFDYMANYMAAI